MITIYNFQRGARGLRVMWLCEEMELPYRAEFVTFPVSEAYRSKNLMGTVPLLEDEGGIAINESVAMLLYVAQKYGPTPLLPDRDDPRFARVIQMTVFTEATFGAGMNVLMAAHFGAPGSHKKNWSVRTQEDQSEKAVRFLEGILDDNAYIAGSEMTLADLAVSTAFGVWKGALEKTIPERIAAYRERLAARPAYQRAMKANGHTAS